MRVELPTGQIIDNVPEGTTKEQLAAKLQANGIEVPPEWLEPSMLEEIGRGVKSSFESLEAFKAKMAFGLGQRAMEAGQALGLTEKDFEETAVGKSLGEAAQALSAAAERDRPKTVAGSLAMVPEQVLEYAVGMGPAKAGAERYEELTRAGVTEKRAAVAAAGSFALASAATAIPFGKGLFKGAAVGAATNIGALVADKEFTKLALGGHYDQIEKQYGITKEELISSGALGLVFGGLVGHITGKETPGIGKAQRKAANDAFEDLVKEDPAAVREAVSNIPDPKDAAALAKRINELVPTAKDVKKMFAKKEMRQSPIEMDEMQLQDIFRKAKEKPVPEGAPAEGTPAPETPIPPKTRLAEGKILGETTPAFDSALEKLRSGRRFELTAEEKLALSSSGKDVIITPEQAAADLRNTLRAAHETEKISQKVEGTPPPGADDPVIFMHAGLPFTKKTIDKAFEMGHAALKKVPLYDVVERETKQSVEQFVRNVVPEALGKQAKEAAAVIAKSIAGQMQRESSIHTRAKARKEFWNARLPEANAFINGFERGVKFADPILEKAADGYRRWNAEILKQDEANGIKYEARDNYLYHVFKDSDGVSRFFDSRYGGKWRDPKFVKERSFNLYQEAIAAGFEPKFRNPEEIMLARQHASDLAQMRVQALDEMAKFGLARDLVKGVERQPGEVEWRSPNGKRYLVNEGAAQVLHNAFNTKSMWNATGLHGTAFRGAMALKNAIVPVKLALSLFHLLHVQTIDNATGMVRASKGLLSGTIGPQEWMKQMGQAAMYKGIIDNPRTGYRLLNVWKGKVPDAQLTAADRQALAYLVEGGMVPEMSAQYKIGAIDRFRGALQTHSASAALYLPFAAIEAMQKPMFEMWIPSLKIASYLKDVRTALKADPTLLDNPLKRMEAFRRISKSVDNRYGEMAYSTLFWNRTVKDVGVASTLSLGWTLGFLREYGGAGMDIAKAAKSDGTIAQKAASGMLDRPLFVAFYSAQALAYGGMLTWALTGQPPTSLLDYVYPKTGDKNPDGSDARVNTMFYPREFMAAYKHMQTEGVVSGTTQFFLNKATPVAGMVADLWRNYDYFGKEISDPDAPAYKQLQQKLSHVLQELEPISTSSVRRSTDDSLKAYGLSIAGFGPAPKYASEEGTAAAIKHEFKKNFGTRITSYEKAEYGDDSRKLKKYLTEGDSEAYGKQLRMMIDKYHLSSQQIQSIRRNSRIDPEIKMFRTLAPKQQEKILRNMPEEERARFFRYAHPEVRRLYAQGAE